MENILKALDELLGTKEYYIKNLEDEVAQYRKTISELQDKLSATEHRLFNTEQALKEFKGEEQ